MTIIVASSISLISAFLVRIFIQKFNFNAVRASALCTILFFLFLLAIDDTTFESLSVFFGASFIGMSDNKKVSEKQAALACLLFSFVYCYVLPKNIILGGSLGALAFVSCLISIVSFQFSKIFTGALKRPL